MVDVTEDARKALSCVYRAEQKFGMGHLIDILRGSENERILNWGHNNLSTYGIGSDKSKEYWSGVYRSLIHHGYLIQDVGNFSVIKLVKTCWPLMKGEISFSMAMPRVKAVVSKKAKKKKVVSDLEYNQDLFEKLRELRKEFAKLQRFLLMLFLAINLLLKWLHIYPKMKMKCSIFMEWGIKNTKSMVRLFWL